MTTQTYDSRIPIEVNYEQSKKDFLSLAEENLDHGHSKQLFQKHSKKNIDMIIAQKLVNPHLHAKYKVVGKPDGTNVLALKQKLQTSIVQILCWEDIFDLFMPLHVMNHGGRNSIVNQIRRNGLNYDVIYKYPIQSLSYFRQSCNVCVQKQDKFILPKACQTCEVHIIAMVQTRPGETFRYLLIYVEQWTQYVVLRPLTARNDLEIAMELLKIFTQFGPPIKLTIHGYNPTLTEKVAKTLNILCPYFKMKTEHQPVRYELPTVIIDKLDDWMEKTKSPVWEVGCFIVQSEMNNCLAKPTTHWNKQGFIKTKSTHPKTNVISRKRKKSRKQNEDPTNHSKNSHHNQTINGIPNHKETSDLHQVADHNQTVIISLLDTDDDDQEVGDDNLNHSRLTTLLMANDLQNTKQPDDHLLTQPRKVKKKIMLNTTVCISPEDNESNSDFLVVDEVIKGNLANKSTESIHSMASQNLSSDTDSDETDPIDVQAKDVTETWKLLNASRRKSKNEYRRFSNDSVWVE